MSFAELQIASDQQARPFVAVGEDLEQQFGAGAAERQVAEFVADQQLGAVTMSQEPVELVAFLGFFEPQTTPS